ncbi:MAG: hypothetical protein AAGA43_05615 [Bacteroidota bacterium]
MILFVGFPNLKQNQLNDFPKCIQEEYFPYFGEIQLGGAGFLGSNNAIQFEGVPENVKMDKDSKGYQITFRI